ncbi:MAG TPA: DUF4919 domain-containing protein [Thermoanaerobaculia bacterium]|jgi:hypothetical protein|nr:DUF4919 domain-containing protein [Thermoanaerobaculia bacterium]
MSWTQLGNVYRQEGSIGGWLAKAGAGLLILALSVTAAYAGPKAPKTETKQKEFDELIARVKKDDTSVDFSHLRSLSTELDSYSPTPPDTKEMFAALREGDYKKALKQVDKVLAENYLDSHAHFVGMIAADKLGDASRSAHHRYVENGILDSILRSGDGKTTDTAYKVVSVSEEYALLRSLGLQSQQQDLVDLNGHSFDVLSVSSPKSKAVFNVYFSIDPITAAEIRHFQ